MAPGPFDRFLPFRPNQPPAPTTPNYVAVAWGGLPFVVWEQICSNMNYFELKAMESTDQFFVHLNRLSGRLRRIQFRAPLVPAMSPPISAETRKSWLEDRADFEIDDFPAVHPILSKLTWDGEKCRECLRYELFFATNAQPDLLYTFELILRSQYPIQHVIRTMNVADELITWPPRQAISFRLFGYMGFPAATAFHLTNPTGVTLGDFFNYITDPAMNVYNQMYNEGLPDQMLRSGGNNRASSILLESLGETSRIKY